MADCKTCKERRAATEPVPYLAHESAMARMERTIKRLWILLIVVVTLLVASNGAWLWYDSQYEDITVTQENADGYNNFIGNDGDVVNGETND